MKKMALIICTFFCFAGYSQAPHNLFEKGNKLYKEKEFEQAIETYQSVIEEGYENAALYFNLGNAYYRTNQLAMAILNYERAARLEPYDDDIRQNLNIARQATIDRFEAMPEPMMRAAYLAVLRFFSPDTWAIIGLSGLFILLAGTFGYLYTTIRKPGFVAAVAGLIICILGLSLAYAHQNYIENNRPAIITATSSYIKSGPGEKAEDVFILHEGARVLVTEQYQQWRKIRLPDGKVGWIESEDLVEV